MDGIAAAEAIRDRVRVPVVYLTAYADEDTLKRARITEPFGYVLKPFEERELRTVIEMALYKHKAERALREAEEKYRNIFENAVEGIFQSKPDGRLLTANPALAHMLGHASSEELIAAERNIAQDLDVIPEQRDRFRELLRERGVVRGFEAQLHRKDASKIWVSVSARAVRNAGGSIVRYRSPGASGSKRKSAMHRRWRPSASSPEAWRTISTTS